MKESETTTQQLTINQKLTHAPTLEACPGYTTYQADPTQGPPCYLTFRDDDPLLPLEKGDKVMVVITGNTCQILKGVPAN